MARSVLGFGFVACSFIALAALACSSSSSDPSTPDGGTGTPDGGGDAGSEASDPCPATGKGSLTVSVTGLPAGVKAKVLIDGPGGKQEIEAPATLSTGAGTYTASGAIVTTPDPLVRSVFKAKPVAGSGTCVKDGATATVEIAYALVPSSNKLWTTGRGSADLYGFGAAKLGATATQAADVALKVGIPGATAFDRDGGLWVVLGTTVAHYPADLLGASGTKTADVVLTVPTGGVPALAGIALDGAGNLWLAAPTDDKVHRIAAADLRATGTPANLVTISGVNAPGALAFDAAGNLWVGDGNNEVVEFAAGRLAASTTAAPDVVLTAQTPAPVVGPLTAPSGIAFDATGNMWVDFNDTLARFTPADRTASALLTPAVQIALDVVALSQNLVFDEGGGLWLSYTAGKFARLSATQLAASGTVTPQTVITDDTIGFADQLAIYPAPAALPLFGKVP
jgi:sugar lactone lactonase YvrE